METADGYDAENKEAETDVDADVVVPSRQVPLGASVVNLLTELGQP